MTCGLHGKLDTAVAAVKDVLTTALDGDHTEETLEEILSAFNTLKSVNKRLGHQGTGITFTPDSTLGDALTFNDDIDIDTTYAAGPVNIMGGMGSDVITFGDDIHNDN
jgi:hypothetical protein